MTISRKLNKSITTALITLLMLSTFVGLVSFANAATVSSPSTLTFSKTGSGTYLWSTTQAASGDFSVETKTTASSGSVEVKLPTNFLFGTPNLDANSFSAMVYPVATSTDLLNKLTMKVYMDSDGNGNADYYFNLTTASLTDGAWNLFSSATWKVQNSTIQSGQTLGTSVNGIANGVIDTYPAWNATAGFADDSVLAVSVILSASGAANTVYVDAITAGLTTYNLEPIALTLNQASATFQQATATAPTADTVNVFAANATFTNGETVTIFFQGVAGAVGSGIATPNGGLSDSFVVPNVAAGTYTITALGTTSGRTFTANLVVAAPTITLNPTAATAGSTVAITGTNFNIGGEFNMTFNGVAWGAIDQAVQAGGVISTTAVVPTLPTGTYVVTVTDGLNTATANFVIPTPTITLSPTSGPSGTTLAVKGMGFSLNGLIQIYFAGTLIWSATADATGNLTAMTGISVTVPDKVAGAYSVIVVDVTTGASSNTATFTVSSPTIKVAPLTGQVGSTFVFNATNFKVNAPVNVKFNGVSIQNITASGTGAIANTSLTVPSVVPGTYQIDATDGINSASVSYTVPEATITLTPDAGPVGTTFYVAGTNFKVSSPITITFNGTAMANSATSSATGSFNQSETVPAGFPIGAFIVNATDGVTFATATYNIGAAITALNATSGPVGSGISVSGLGFTNSGPVEIYFGSTLMKAVNATSTGALASTGANAARFTVPDVTFGAYQITVLDVTSGVTTPAVTYTVQRPTLTLAPTENQVGTVVMVTGAQYKLDSTVTITFNGILVATLTADHNGALPANANFTVPSVVPGAYTVNATDGVNFITATYNVFGSGGIDTIINMLSQYGSFWNFTNDWFMTINNKLGNFTGDDTVASLLYSIQSQVNLPSEYVFNFGGVTNYRPEYIQITTASVYDSDEGYGWLDTTGLQTRDRAGANDALRAFIFANTDKTFQVDLPDGEYLVTVTQGDQLFPHDGMTIVANGELVSTQSVPAGQFPQAQFTVEVEDGYLQLTFGQSGATNNWVVNSVTIRQALP